MTGSTSSSTNSRVRLQVVELLAGELVGDAEVVGAQRPADASRTWLLLLSAVEDVGAGGVDERPQAGAAELLGGGLLAPAAFGRARPRGVGPPAALLRLARSSSQSAASAGLPLLTW